MMIIVSYLVKRINAFVREVWFLKSKIKKQNINDDYCIIFGKEKKCICKRGLVSQKKDIAQSILMFGTNLSI